MNENESENESNSSWSRRGFLKVMGLGGASGALLLSGCGNTDIINEVDLQVRKEHVYPNVNPKDFVIPGVQMYYASTCRQCPAGCGIHARIREGRVLKLEGNPASEVNLGRLCPMGQAGLQGHYNPDRLTKPLLRKGGKLVEISWDRAQDILQKKLGSKNARLGWLSGAISGHQAALIDAYMAAAGSNNHFVFDTLPPAVGHAVNEEMFGNAMPRLDFGKAELIVSFGADFLGTWMSPVQFATQYAEFRNVPRGALVQIEPKMTLTGANADRLITIRPGSEGHLALGLASLLAENPTYADRIPAEVAASLKAVNVDEVSRLTDVPAERIHHLHHQLMKQSPSLILSGPSAEGVPYGTETARAILMLNVMLGNVGKTILPRSKAPFPDLMPRMGGWAQARAMLDGLNSGKIDTAVVFGSNLLYQAPAFMQADKAFAKAKFRVSFSMFPDETSMASDLVLPINSYLEDWNTTMPAYAPEDGYLGLQQPVMERVFGVFDTKHGSTRSFGDIMLNVLKQMNTKFNHWKNYETYITDSLWTMRPALVNPPTPTVGGQTEQEAFHQGILSAGFVRMKVEPAAEIQAKVSPVSLPKEVRDEQYPFRLIPIGKLGLWDGRHANLPWLQELPDQIAEVVWNSWVEIHPKVAKKLGVITGDVVNVASAAGSIDVKVVILPGIHEDAVSIPLGQGHTEYGRYAKGRGVNPYSILTAQFDKQSGELATFATNVKLTKVTKGNIDLVTLNHGGLVLESNTSRQAGREIVKTTTAKEFNLTEEEI